MASVSLSILIPVALAITNTTPLLTHYDISDGALPLQLVRVFSDKFQGNSSAVTPASFTSKWTERMSPYTDCRSRYAIENNVFYNGAGVRAVNSDFSDSEGDSFDDGDSGKYLFRERFHDDDYQSDTPQHSGSFSVEPASPSSSDDHHGDGYEFDDYLHSVNESSRNDTEYDFIDFTAVHGLNESNGSPLETAEGAVSSVEDPESWTNSVNAVNSLSAYVQPSTESVSRIEFSRRNFLIAMLVLMLNIMGIILYFVCYRLRHGQESRDDEECENDRDFIIESDPEM